MALSASSKPCAGYWSMAGEASCKDIELGPPLSALSCSCTGAGAGKRWEVFHVLVCPEDFCKALLSSVSVGPWVVWLSSILAPGAM